MAVELFRIPKPPRMDVFDLGGRTWDSLLELGKAFGWIPQGTQLVTPLRPEDEAKLEASLVKARKHLEELEAIPNPSRPIKLDITLTRSWIADRLNPYAPVLWGDLDMRRVTPEDAAALAEALERALQELRRLDVDLPHKGGVYLSESMDEQLYLRTNGGISRKILEDFIPFLRRGGFGISVWD